MGRQQLAAELINLWTPSMAMAIAAGSSTYVDHYVRYLSEGSQAEVGGTRCSIHWLGLPSSGTLSDFGFDEKKTLVNMSKAALIDGKQKHFTSIEFFGQFWLRFSAFLSYSLAFCLILVPLYII